MRALFAFLDRSSRPFLVVCAALVLFIVAVVDFVTGPDVRFFIFYWPLIGLLGWYVGRGWAYLFVALSGIAWFLANAAESLGPGQISTTLWNAVVNLASFALLAVLVVRLRALVERERLLARTDHTTGIANARAFAEAVEGAAARSRRTGVPLTVAYLDLDDFKRVNDRLGHSAGNGLLRSVANVLRAGLRISDTVARLGGDEFGVLLPDTGRAEAVAVVRRCLAALTELAAGERVTVSASVGVVTCVPGTGTVDDLILRADQLMYEVKSGSKAAFKHLVMRPDGTEEAILGPEGLSAG